MTHTLAGILLLLLASADGPDPGTVSPDPWKTGYSIGYQIGSDFRQQGLELDSGLLVQGILDALAGADPLLTREEMDRSLSLLQERARSAEAGRSEEAARFVRDYEDREGVVRLSSGLLYRILRAGSGPRPGPGSKVTIHYTGTLPDGSEFDSSRARSEPATFIVRDSIPGWVEAIQLMRQGALWEIVLPPELGYGDRPWGRVAPGSTLVFEIELLSVADPD